MNGSAPLQSFALEQISQRLNQLQAEAENALKSQDPDAVHDLRVSMRRFVQGLILFPGLLARDEIKGIRSQLKTMMSLTSEIRNRDIAREHLKNSRREAIQERLSRERAAYAEAFRDALQKWLSRGFAARWRSALRLEAR